jgi:phosphate transport system substrate-binding protein
MTEFIKYVLSKEGQQIVIKDGFYPVSKTLAEEDLKQMAFRENLRPYLGQPAL